MSTLSRYADAETVAKRAAPEIAGLVADARRERGRAHLALSGGTTPARTYQLLAGELASWVDVEIWFADERCVEPDDERSNFRLARETLLDAAAGLAQESVHRMEGELGPERGARRYAEQLRARVAPAAEGDGTLPALDVTVLGIGPDGHIASLFGCDPALDAPSGEICLAIRNSPKPPPQRISLSLPVLGAARACVMLATGPAKAQAVAAMLAEPTARVPASLLPRERLSVIVDDAAGERLLQ